VPSSAGRAATAFVSLPLAAVILTAWLKTPAAGTNQLPVPSLDTPQAAATPTATAPAPTPQATLTVMPEEPATPTATSPAPPANPPSPAGPFPALLFLPVFPVSEVAPAVTPPPEPADIDGPPGELAVAPGTKVVWGGCASDGTCLWYNFYWSPTHEAVLQTGEGPDRVQHELCHAHQHWTINQGAPLDPSDYDLQSWYSTPEGQSYTAAVVGLPWPWSNSAVNGIEDFAWTCAYWYLDPAFLRSASPERSDWAAQHLR